MSGPVAPGATDVRPRMLLLARRLYEGELITTRYIASEFGVSRRTASADIAQLRMYLPCDVIPYGNRVQGVRLVRGMRRSARNGDAA